MKVLFLSNEHAHSESAYARRLDHLRQAIERQGIQTAAVSLRDQFFGRPILAQAANIPFMRHALARCDFIHAGGDAAYSAVFAKPLTAAQIIHDAHGDTLSDACLKWQVKPGARTAFMVAQSRIATTLANRQADHIIAASIPLLRRLIEEKHVPPRKVALVRNGVDPGLFVPQDDPLPDRFTICYAGGFQSWQAIDDLVTAVAQFPDSAIRLKIVGFTNRDGAIKARIAARLGDRAELVDRVPQRDLISHLARAHILISPRPNHRAAAVGFPFKFAEYLALGKPVIVYDVDETADMVRTYHCGLVSASGVENLAATLARAAALSEDDLRAMGENGRKLAESTLAWDVIGQHYAELLTTWMTER